MPKREILTRVSVTFTNEEYNQLMSLYNQLDALLEDSYPEVTDEGLQSLIDNLQATLDSLMVE